MSVNLKLFILLFLQIFKSHSSIIKRSNASNIQQERVLRLLPMKTKIEIKRQLQNCDQDSKCVKKILQSALKKIKNLPNKHRKLRNDSNHTMKLLIVMILIYLMFTQPLMAGLILFLGGMSGFTSFLRRERRLNSVSPQILAAVENFSQSQIRNMYQSERGKLFHYFQSNPVKFKKLNQRRLKALTIDYFDQVHNMNTENLREKISKEAHLIFKNKKFIEKQFLKPKQFQINFNDIQFK